MAAANASSEPAARGRDSDNPRAFWSTFGERSAAALTEVMSVLDDDVFPELADEQFVVVSESGAEYRVDMISESCDCPDSVHRGERCKHQRRVDYARGLVPIPPWADEEAIDDGLGQHLSAAPRIARKDGSTEVLNDV